ncbi:hypothetical protein K461DRAFT_291448 [Myriangium duriaei CBS 260.36]|uniref:Rhodopsin domain-containing protein n=1 Tax=Myriangium duriaei CBS 260.36 TaxID=1168546 RepID=A0A9P4J3M8_9PEZI|nr:hypothetical protein K461DRAFT_291448 [Myriangium duriaei CBS 260.36]
MASPIVPSLPLNPYKNNYASIIGFDIASLTTCVILVSLRLYCRLHLVKKSHWDDWLLLSAVICWIPSCLFDVASWLVLANKGVVAGSGYSSYYENIGTFFYVSQDILTRGAYLVFYLRIMPVELGYRWHRVICIAVYSLYAVYLCAYAFINTFRCGVPINLLDPNAICLDVTTQGILFDLTYVCDIISDWSLAVVAMDVMRRTVKKRKARLTILSVLALGFVAGIIAIFVPPFANLSALGTDSSEDLSRSIVIDILVTCEATVCMMCLCLAALKPLYEEWFAPVVQKTVSEASSVPTLPTLATLQPV